MASRRRRGRRALRMAGREGAHKLSQHSCPDALHLFSWRGTGLGCDWLSSLLPGLRLVEQPAIPAGSVCLRPLGHSHPRKEPSWARCAVADVALRGSGVWGGAEERSLELGICLCLHPLTAGLATFELGDRCRFERQARPAIGSLSHRHFQLEGVGDARCPRLQ